MPRPRSTADLRGRVPRGRPPVVAAVIFGRINVLSGFVLTTGLMMIGFLGLFGNFRVCGIAAHVLAPCAEAVYGAGHVLDKRAGCPGKRAVLRKEQIVAVAIASDSGISILISRDRDVID